MKKNLRIVSAAAAALLAVAPVAAAAVATPASVVNAATTTYKKGDTVVFPKDTVATNGNGTASHITFKAGKHYTAFGDENGNHMVPFKVNGEVVFANVDSFQLAARTTKSLHVNSDKAYLYTNDGNKNFTKTSDKLAEGTVVTVYSEPVEANDGTVYYEIANGANVGKYVKLDQASKTVSEASTAYFEAYNTADMSEGTVLARHAYANNQVVTALPKYSKAKTLSELKEDIMATVKFMKDSKTPYNREGWNKYIFGDEFSNNATNDQNLISQLKNEGVDVTGTGSEAKINAGANQYRVTVRSNGGLRVTIVFQNTDAVNLNSPAFSVRSDKWSNVAITMNQYAKSAWSQPLNDPAMIPSINLYKRDAGKFNPLDYIEATPNRTTNATISYTVKSNDVDWTKVGLYHVTVTATNDKGKTTELTIPVVVNDNNGKLMSAIKDTNYYRLDGANLVLANLTANVLHTGDQVHVFGNAVTKKLNGQDVQVYQVGGPTSNLYVLASDLKDGAATPAANETTANKTIMHIAAVYTKNGVKTTERLRAYDSVSVVATPVTLKDANGKEIAGKFYKLAGQDKYIKVSNVDGTSKTLKHNSYVYTQYGKKVYKKNGKAVKMPKRGKRGSLRKEASGKTLTVYGGALFNKQYYRIGRNQYIKVANFR